MIIFIFDIKELNYYLNNFLNISDLGKLCCLNKNYYVFIRLNSKFKRFELFNQKYKILETNTIKFEFSLKQNHLDICKYYYKTEMEFIDLLNIAKICFYESNIEIIEWLINSKIIDINFLLMWIFLRMRQTPLIFDKFCWSIKKGYSINFNFDSIMEGYGMNFFELMIQKNLDKREWILNFCEEKKIKLNLMNVDRIFDTKNYYNRL